MKAKFDDRVIALHEIRLSDGSVIPVGAHGFVIEAFESPAEAYEVEFYVENPRSSGDDTVLATIGPDDFGVG